MCVCVCVWEKYLYCNSSEAWRSHTFGSTTKTGITHSLFHPISHSFSQHTLTHINTYSHILKDTHTRTHSHTHTHIETNTHIHTHSHTHAPGNSPASRKFRKQFTVLASVTSLLLFLTSSLSLPLPLYFSFSFSSFNKSFIQHTLSFTRTHTHHLCSAHGQRRLGHKERDLHISASVRTRQHWEK